MEIRISMRTTKVRSSIVGCDQGEQFVVTTKLINIIRRTSLKITRLHVATLFVHVEVIFELLIPSLVVNNEVKSLEFLSTTIPLTPTLNRCRSKTHFDFQHTSCIKCIYYAYNDL